MKKINNEEIHKFFIANGYKIIQGEIYQGSNIKMLCFNDKGYKVMISRDSILKGSQPSMFSVHNPHTIYNIKKWLIDNATEYELLSDEFKGVHNKLIFQLKNSELPPFEATWSNFCYGGTRHPYFHYDKVSESERFNLEEVRKKYDEYLEETEWFLPNEEELKYKNTKSKLKVYDSDGYMSEISLGGLFKGRRPQRFHKNLKETSTYNMIKYLKENTSYMLKDGQIYKGNDEEYTFICPNHGEFKTKWVIVQYGHLCMNCYIENNKGENHPSWNPNLTEEDRMYLRKIDGYKKWRTEVYKRDGYCCVSCKKRGNGDLVAHHLDGYSWCVEKRTDVNNGVTLCELCHSAFHGVYGFKNNTKEQFQEWIEQRDDIEEIKKKTIIIKWKRKKRETPVKKSGIKGITWDKRLQKWRVRFQRNRKNIEGGHFENLEDAIRKKEELLSYLHY